MRNMVVVIIVFLTLLSCAGFEKDPTPLVPERFSILAGQKESVVTRTGRTTMRYAELGNGLRVLAIEMPDSPVSVGTIGFRVGGRYEPESRAGISHMLEHMLFRGGENEGVKAIRRVGGSVNALTDYELTYYHFTVLPEYFGDSLSALCGMVFEPDFDWRDLKKEREVVLEELARGKNDPRALALSSLVRRVFPSSPLRNLVIGTERSVRSITLEDLYRFHAAYYNLSNAIVVCAGPFDSAETVRVVRERFEGFPPTPVPVVEFSPPAIAVHELSRKIPVNQAVYIQGALSPGRADESYYAMNVLDLVLGSGKNSRLQRKITAEEHITEDVFIFRHTLSDTGIWTVMFSADPADIGRVKQLVTEEIALLRNGDLTEQEVGDAKRGLAARELIRLESPNALAVFELQNILFRNEVVPVESHIERIEKITRDDVQKTAHTYLSDENSVSISLIPAPSGERLFLLLKIAVTGEI